MGSSTASLFLLLGCFIPVFCITREYFIGIREIQWDYAPTGKNVILNKLLKEDEHAATFLERGPQRIGSVYKKAVYLQYTDATYTKEITKPKWLGFLGPVMSAEEGDVIKVHLKNMATRAYSIHSHGIMYNKTSEGALYPDETTDAEKHDDRVDPGKSYTYVWVLSDTHAPTKDDTNCLARAYHSHLHAPQDIASGLVGPLIICKKGTLDVYGDKAADYSYVLMFTVSDENMSWYLDDNIKTYCTQQSTAANSPQQPSPAVNSPQQPSPAVNSPQQPSPAVNSPQQPSPAVNSPQQPSTAANSPQQPSPAANSPQQPSPAANSPQQPSPAANSPQQPTTKVDKDDEAFQESNLMHSINGFVYGNLPDLSMCVGNKIHWHLIGMGNEVDIHSVFFHGQILTNLGHHTDAVSLFPATFTNVEMTADNPGHWLLSCQVNDHLMAGMQALFEVKKCFPAVHKPRPNGEVREYFIAAEEVLWDYAPSQVNHGTGKPLNTDGDSETFFQRGNDRIGGKYKKVQYKEYTDNTFTVQKERTPEELHLGILGPVIRAEEEDTIKVVFKNKASRPFSMQPHGVQYNVEQSGTLYYNELEESYTAKKLREIKKETRTVTPPPAALVKPGTTHTYEWVVPKGGGPVADDADCITYFYYSAVDPVKDTSSGLVGPLLVCKKKTLKKGKQKNVNKEFHMLATVFDENLSWFLDDNINQFTKAPKTVNKEDEDFQESNKMHSINGYMYGNLPGLTMCKGDKVSWHLSGLGSEADIHGLYFEGNRLIYRETRRDVMNVFPHISHTVMMEPDSMGQFEVVCQTTDHYQGGMRANYTVQKCSMFNRQSEIMLHSKTYYIAAMEIDWDYSPNRTWEQEMYHGLTQSPGNDFIDKQGKFIGSIYKKVVYREFTNNKFTKQKERSADMQHLGILGPMIHADIGDKVNIVFKNMATRTYSIHAHGVKTDVPQVKETKPGETQTYTWYVPKTAGPTDKQETCSVGAYYSTVDVNKDLYSGLIGPLVICRRSYARSFGLKKEVEEFALLFMVFDENESWYLDDNIKTNIKTPTRNIKEDEDFIESNKMHGINGQLYGNLLGLNMEVGDKVYWYLMGMGNEIDIHTAHFHGHSFDYKLSGGSHRADVFGLFPGTFQTVKMKPKYPGSWLLHCHVADHIKAGMVTVYKVTEKEKKGFFG
ncbi:ceruloplasmin [Oncorhynchus kisutch]|uniref:ferroxidase n=1 Tax=Oncorhynchus kisutch TaxID=8019 RepID=A0A8C7JL55_ONCKI|nr:ceruloplasmin [Oncorhynchus kisutch]